MRPILVSQINLFGALDGLCPFCTRINAVFCTTGQSLLSSGWLLSFLFKNQCGHLYQPLWFLCSPVATLKRDVDWFPPWVPDHDPKKAPSQKALAPFKAIYYLSASDMSWFFTREISYYLITCLINHLIKYVLSDLYKNCITVPA